MILVLLPHCDYDPTESSVPWQYLHRAGIAVRFATPQGTVASCRPTPGGRRLRSAQSTADDAQARSGKLPCDARRPALPAPSGLRRRRSRTIRRPAGPRRPCRGHAQPAGIQRGATDRPARFSRPTSRSPRSATARCCSPEPLIPIPPARYCSVARSPACCL